MHAVSHMLHIGKYLLPYILSAHKASKVPILTFSYIIELPSFYTCKPLLKAT